MEGAKAALGDTREWRKKRELLVQVLLVDISFYSHSNYDVSQKSLLCSASISQRYSNTG